VIRRALVVAVLSGVLASLTLAACKQGSGGHCQVQSDCDDGLICLVSTSKCSDQSGAGVDAAVVVPKEAGLDAPVDAPPDAP
jgi:hypothetical protein